MDSYVNSVLWGHLKSHISYFTLSWSLPTCVWFRVHVEIWEEFIYQIWGFPSNPLLFRILPLPLHCSNCGFLKSVLCFFKARKRWQDFPWSVSHPLLCLLLVLRLKIVIKGESSLSLSASTDKNLLYLLIFQCREVVFTS